MKMEKNLDIRRTNREKGNRCMFIYKRLPGVAENFPENSAAKMKVMPADYFMIWESSANRRRIESRERVVVLTIGLMGRTDCLPVI